MTRTAGRGVLVAVLVILMALGSVLLWLGVPLFWVWLASQIAESSQPSLGLYLMVLAGIPATMVVVGKALGALNRTHAELTGRIPARREQTVWLKSMRGERQTNREHGVLGTVMAISVSIALVLFGIWFFFFAGSSLPGT
jgi:hypothetical protein